MICLFFALFSRVLSKDSNEMVPPTPFRGNPHMWKTGHLEATKRQGNAPRSLIRFSIISILLCLAGLTAACSAPLQSGNNTSNTGANELRVTTQAGRASVGVAYNAVTSVSGGSAPYLFRISSGSLPPGTSLNSATGSITGTPSVVGTYNFVLSALSSASGSTSASFHLVSGSPEPTPSPTVYGSTPVQIVVVSGGSGGDISISISPSSATIPSQGQQQFTAQVSGTANTAVTWSASAGTISSTGDFTAPKVTSNTTVTVTATSASSSSLHATATLTVTPQVVLTIANSTLPQGQANTPYGATLSASGGVSPYHWSLSSGTLPSGIQLQASSGVITGMTALSGSYPFTPKVTDASGKTATQPFTLTISSGSASGFDGPAELPRVYIQTAMANTPAPGTTTTVNAGGDFQSALNNANCGDTIQLQAGATFTGAFNFPAKSCDDNHWIIVRTSSADSLLPPEGSRLTPCYAGVSSLPGRPAFQCASTKNVLAKLVMATSSSGPIVFVPGANHYRLVGLEITRTAGIGIVYALASVAATGGTANNLILDRVWAHGTAQDETKRGFEFGGISYASAIDSTFTDFHCISATGICTDASAVGGDSGDPVGPFKVVDNFLEASGENILFGGAGGTITPTDIQISQNHFFKPLTWMKGQVGYVGAANGNPFIVKNLLELKNAQRVLVEANIMEYSWGGFSQTGYGIVVTPTNQSGNCPICQVTDITIRYNTISHVGAGLQIANDLSAGAPALDGQRYSIHDITIDDMNAVKYAGSGNFAEIMRVSPNVPQLQNVSINHVTAFAPTNMFMVGGTTTDLMPNFIFNNSIFLAGTYPIWSTGGSTDCANYDKPLTTFNDCFSTYSFAKNAMIATPSAYPASLWPAGNFFPATASTVQFVNYNNAIGGNYQLLSTSPYHNAGTDGKDLGADVATIVSETTGVY